MNIITNTQGSTSLQRQILNKEDGLLIEKARNIPDADLKQLKQKEYLTIEESQMLLIRMLDEEYLEP